MNKELMREFIFWGIWLVIPLLVDVLTGIISGIFVLKGYFSKGSPELEYLPHVTILIPVYKSEKTLKNCLQSIIDQTYPLKNIMVLLLNNGPKDDSYQIFNDFQEINERLKIRWLDSSQGKAKALNKGLYMSEGKYIINIDSDGVLEKNAIMNVVKKFESNPDVLAMTGVILTDTSLIEESKSLGQKLLQRCELFEYAESFVVGRGYQSKTNTMFTLAGAFSCYRKDAVLKTQLYNNETLGEDTHMTSQIRHFLGGRVELCEDAFFFVDPIESWDRLYIQRQRWQRGEMEVSSLFKEKKGNANRSLSNVLRYTMIKDHTLVFPRFIWIFAMIYLVFLDYPISMIFGANIIMFLVYALNSMLYFQITKLYLKDLKHVLRYMEKHYYTVLLLPLYRFVVFFMRVAGIINSVERFASWNTKTFSEEKIFILKNAEKKLNFYLAFKAWVNSEAGKQKSEYSEIGK